VTRAAVALLLLLPLDALACPTCGAEGGPNSEAFVDMSVFLSLFPLAMMGAIVGYYWYHQRAE
jgi:hypothetical protein